MDKFELTTIINVINDIKREGIDSLIPENDCELQLIEILRDLLLNNKLDEYQNQLREQLKNKL